jgi:hypothetical protein
MTIIFGGQGVQPTLRGQPTNVWALQPGNCKLIPAGTWLITPGLYSVVQELDAISGIWRAIGSGLGAGASGYINSDGNNFRVANQSGCVVGAIVTTAGAGFTTAPAATVSNGNAVLQTVIGGAVSTTVTVTNGGKNYTYPPIVLFDASTNSPGSYDVQATGYCTISGGAVTSVTVTDQGAGYTNVPNVSFQNDPRDTTGTGASATATLTGSGTVTAVLVSDFGNSYTSNAVPTISFSGTSTSGAAATAIMNWSVASYSVTSAGGFYTAPVLVTSTTTGFTTTAGSTTNPTITSNLVRTRPARIVGAVATGAISATGQTVVDGGVFTGVPTLIALGFSSGSPANVAAANMTGVQDTTLILPV